MLKGKKQKNVGLLLVLVALSGICLLYLENINHHGAVKNNPQSLSVPSLLLTSYPELTPWIDPSTKIIQEIEYPLCNEIIVEEKTPPMSWYGYSPEKLQEILPHAQIIHFDMQRVMLRVVNEGPCLNMLNKRTIKGDNGFVAIFYGHPDLLGPRITKTQIALGNLSPQLRTVINSGIVFEHMHDALVFLQQISTE